MCISELFSQIQYVFVFSFLLLDYQDRSDIVRVSMNYFHLIDQCLASVGSGLICSITENARKVTNGSTSLSGFVCPLHFREMSPFCCKSDCLHTRNVTFAWGKMEKKREEKLQGPNLSFGFADTNSLKKQKCEARFLSSLPFFLENQ